MTVFIEGSLGGTGNKSAAKENGPGRCATGPRIGYRERARYPDPPLAAAFAKRLVIERRPASTPQRAPTAACERHALKPNGAMAMEISGLAKWSVH
jgi:hypothetical protein